MPFLLRPRKKSTVGPVICVVVEEDIMKAARKIGVRVDKNACCPDFAFVSYPECPDIEFALERVKEGKNPEIVKKFIMFSNRRKLAVKKKTEPDNN